MDKITETLGLVKMDKITETLGPTGTKVAGAIICYAALCRSLRYLRRDRRHAQMPYKKREDFAKMTGEDAFEIVQYVQALEFPWMSAKALAFALFK
jgi:hypothetical protein